MDSLLRSLDDLSMEGVEKLSEEMQSCIAVIESCNSSLAESRKKMLLNLLKKKDELTILTSRNDEKTTELLDKMKEITEGEEEITRVYANAIRNISK